MRTFPGLLGGILFLGFLIASVFPQASRAEAPPAATPLGQLIELTPTINGETFSRVSRAALNLRIKAEQEKRQGILILQIQDGPSRYGDVRELAKFIASDIPQLRTIAWIPRDVRGVNAIIPLACHEIVMNPRASLGDIGSGEAVDPDSQAFILGLLTQRRNPLLSDALVTGMLDRSQEVIWIRMKAGEGEKGTSEARVVLSSEFERLTQAKTIIEDQRTLKAAGGDGMFLATRCRDLNVLSSNLFEDDRSMLAHFRLGTEALREQFTIGTDLKVAVIRIQGIIDTMYEEYLHRQIDRQIGLGVNLLIFEVDSPGGMLQPCVNLAQVFAECKDRKVRTVAYIPRQAISGGAIVSFGCDEIYMHPEALIGDAQPIEVRPGEAFRAVPEKIISKVAQDLKVIAERKQRSPALLQAMVDKDLEVFKATHQKSGQVAYMSELEISQQADEWQKGPLVPESKAGMILTVNGQRAYELRLAEAPVKNFDELKGRLGIPLEMRLIPLAPMFVDRLVFLLNSSFVTGLLLFLGIVCIYMEMHLPSGLFAIGGVVCFALFFWSRFLGGTAGLLEVTLFLIGIACLALEIFVLPGFGVFGISGGLLVIASLVLASQTFLIPVSHQDYTEFSRSISSLGLAVLIFGAVAATIGQVLPRSRLWDHLVLTPPGVNPHRSPKDPRLAPNLVSAEGTTQRSVIGARGEAISILRPSGKAKFGEKYLDVVSEGPFIEQGTPIEVVIVEGSRIVVRKIT